jgi:GntR family transcriptional regulator, rspAB operon transcriptional repressor
MIDEVLDLTIAKPLSIREQVYKRISDLILSGQIAPGERIMENKVSKQLGVSRTPIREALHVLEMEGFLEAIPRVGYQVKEIVWDEVENICDIRKVNETLAACWAMGRITPEELDALQNNLDQAEADVKGGYPKRFIDRDVDFHNILVQASGSRHLVEICQTLRRHMLLYRIESIYEPEMVLSVIEDHRCILDRLRAHDVAGLTQAISDHLDHVKREVLHYAFESRKGRGSIA